MKWNELRDNVHRVAVEHGWWEKPLTFSEIIVMCHSELSEAMEEYRAGRTMVYCEKWMDPNADCTEELCGGLECLRNFQDRKPEGVAVELGDCILRILDYMGRVKGDIDGAIRKLRGLSPEQTKEGDARPLPDLVAGCHYLLSSAYMSHRQAEMLRRKRGREVKPAREFHPFRVRGLERAAREKMVGCILDILRWAETNGVDMEAVIIAKNEYNKTRQYRHGGKKL